MKKASLILLIITSSFFCVMLGTLIGRHTTGNHYYTPEIQNAETITETSVDTDPHLLNINTATLSQLDDLPGIGPALAQRIIDYRSANGLFSNIDDLLLVEGIGEFRLNQIKDYISTGG